MRETGSVKSKAKVLESLALKVEFPYRSPVPMSQRYYHALHQYTPLCLSSVGYHDILALSLSP